MLGLSPENSLRLSKDKSCKVHVMKPATLLNIYYFTSIFQGISLGLEQSFVAIYKDWPDKYSTFKN